MDKKRGSFSGKMGFCTCCCRLCSRSWKSLEVSLSGSKYGGGIFLLVYLILAVTFGFTLMITEIAIGRKTGVSVLVLSKKLDKRFGFVGVLACIVPFIITPYYCVIGGWVIKYLFTFLTGK